METNGTAEWQEQIIRGAAASNTPLDYFVTRSGF
jgi:hypothetical protein